MIFARVATALALAVLIVLAVLGVRYESARAVWRAHAESTSYDATSSDDAYRAVEGAQTWIERIARASAALIVLAGIALGRARPRREPTPSRGARVIDLVTLFVVLAASRIHVASPGLTEAIDWTLPALVLSILVGLAVNGASLGQRIIR